MKNLRFLGAYPAVRGAHVVTQNRLFNIIKPKCFLAASLSRSADHFRAAKRRGICTFTLHEMQFGGSRVCTVRIIASKPLDS
jgi:hypothetical protein